MTAYIVALNTINKEVYVYVWIWVLKIPVNKYKQSYLRREFVFTEYRILLLDTFPQ